MQKQKRIGGKFAILPEELGPIFLKLPYSSIALYNFLLLFHKIDEDWKSDPDWVIGTIKARKKEIIEKSSLSEVTFYRKAWAKLIEYGLVKEEKGAILLLKYKRKERDDQLPLELPFITRTNINEENSQNESKLEIEKSQNETKNGSNSETKKSQNETQKSQNETQKSQNETFDHYIRFKDLKSVCTLVDLISLFYGDQKISNLKKTHTLKKIKELEKQGYTENEIAFAIKYALEIKKKKPDDFSIIEHMIGEALAYKKEYEGKERRQAEKEAEIQKEKSRQEEEDRKSIEREDYIRSVKEKMTPEDREVLRQNAFALAEKRKMMREFLTENAIEALENEILIESGVIDHEDQS